MEKEFNAYETFLSKEEELELIQKVCPEVKTLEETFRIEFVVANDKIDDADEKFDVHTLENIVMLMEHETINVENYPELYFTEYHSFIQTNLEGINEVISKAFIKFEDIKDIDSFSALKEIDNTHREYGEAQRLIKLLEYFDDIPDDDIPNTSLLREFIGGSIYHKKKEKK